MRITTQGEYGLRCILLIAESNIPVSVKYISSAEKLSKTYVEQLLLKLRRARIIKSIRGPKGGYVLAKPPSNINVKEIIKALEKDTFSIICHEKRRGKKRCMHLHECSLRPLWELLSDKIDYIFENVSLETLIGSEASVYKRLRRL